jgi:peptidoglycan/LPS O-acetylase OafA/YrhL
MIVSEYLKRENNNIDFIRILLAIGVIINHAQEINGSHTTGFDPIPMLVNYTTIGGIAVHLFFFISGMVVVNSLIHKRDMLYFVISRVFRIVPGLFLVVFVTAFIIGPMVTDFTLAEYFQAKTPFTYVFKNAIFNTQYNLPGVFINHPLPTNVNGSLWSLVFEMCCYFVLFAAFLILGKGKVSYLNIPIIIIFIDAFLPNRQIMGLMGTLTYINLLPFCFAIGAFLAINADKIDINLKVALGFFILLYIFRSAYFARQLFIINAAVFMSYVSSLKSVRRIHIKYDISYGIYLWGFLIQQCIFHYFGTINLFLAVFGSILISVILAYLTHVLVEKPFIQLGKKLYKKINNYPIAEKI